MNLGIDIDDTISNTFECIFAYAQEFIINDLHREAVVNEIDCTTHYYTRVIHGFSDEECELFWNKYYKKIIENVKPKTLASEYLKKLQEEGNKIILITARNSSDEFNLREITENWLLKNNIPFDKLIIDAESKIEFCKDNEIDCFIDDSFKNCLDVSQNNIKTFLMDSNTNKKLNDDMVKRVYSWPYLYNELKK